MDEAPPDRPHLRAVPAPEPFPWEQGIASTSSAGNDTGKDRARDPRALPEAKRNEIVALLAEHPDLSRNEIGRRVGVSGPTVGKIAREIGRSFDRTETAKATEARAIDTRAARVKLAETLVRQAQAAADRLDGLTEDARASADTSRAIGALVRASVDLDRLELERERANRADMSGAEVDLWLNEMTGKTG